MTVLHQIDPIALDLGPLQVHWYGIMYLLGFAVGLVAGPQPHPRRPPARASTNRPIGDLLFYGMLGVVLGGRLGYVLFYSFGDLLRRSADAVARSGKAA